MFVSAKDQEKDRAVSAIAMHKTVGAASGGGSTSLVNGHKGLLLLLFTLLFWTAPCCQEASAAPVLVRFSEGMVRGFLVLSDTKGGRIASGDFLQVRQGNDVKARTLLQFKDGSVHDETAVFSQQRNFLLQSYRLIQKGPAFKEQMDLSLDRKSGNYVVKTKPYRDGKEKVLTGKLDLPLDVYNGMVPTVAKNLVKGTKETIHIVALTPTPRIIELEMTPSGEERVFVGDLKKSALHYVLKPKLGLLKVPALLLGRNPPDNQLWIITAEVPAFVKFEGPLATDGPIWRIELTSPTWPK
jgi:hypothetical protein